VPLPASWAERELKDYENFGFHSTRVKEIAEHAQENAEEEPMYERTMDIDQWNIEVKK
jgi:hypothetical protein